MSPKDVAAADIAKAVAGQGVQHVDQGFHRSRANLFAQSAGVLVIDKDAR